MTLTAKVGKPGSKLIIHGNGRQSLNFSLILLTAIPWDNPKGNQAPTLYVRCKWFDPDYLLNTSDVVRVTGILTKVEKDLGLLCNQVEVLARFVKKGSS